MPRHEIPNHEPSVVMHEDDPVLFLRVNTWFRRKFTRMNVRRLLGALITLTFGLFLWTGWQVIEDQQSLRDATQATQRATDRVADALRQLKAERNSRRAQVNREIDQLACAIVAPIKDRRSQLAREFVKAHHCPPYDPKIADKLRPTATKTATKTVSATPAAPKPTASDSPAPRAGGASGSSNTTTTSVAGPAPIPTHTRATPTPSATPTSRPAPRPSPDPTPVSPTTTPPLIDLCKLAPPICILAP